MKKQLLGVSIIVLILLPVVLAIEDDENIVDFKVKNTVNPDSKLYGLDRALERLSMLVTRDPDKRVALGLVHAQERLNEIKAMRSTKDLVAEQKAKTGLLNALQNIQKDVGNTATTKEDKSQAVARITLILQKRNITGVEI